MESASFAKAPHGLAQFATGERTVITASCNHGTPLYTSRGKGTLAVEFPFEFGEFAAER